MLPLYVPGEPREKPSRPRQVRHLADPRFLEQIYDDPYSMLACAVVMTASGPQPDPDDVSFRPTGERIDRNFLRSKWYERLCAGLEIDADAWRSRLRSAARPAKANGKQHEQSEPKTRESVTE